MVFQIQNDTLQLTVTELGAEMKSLVSLADGREWLWEADPDFWPRTAPVLFPIVGKLADNQYTHAGRYYPLSQHGFARDRVFDCFTQAEDSLRLILRSDYDSHKFYPFDFELVICYTLRANTVEVIYEVINTGTETMWFSIGGHPGFALPGWPQKPYSLHFEKDEPLFPFFLKSGLLGRKLDEALLTHERHLPITPTLFDNDALVFNQLKSRWIGISAEGKDMLRLHFEGFPWVGLWAKTGAPFVCIEPWFGHADPVGESGEISEKPGIVQLPQNETFRCSYTIEIQPVS